MAKPKHKNLTNQEKVQETIKLLDAAFSTKNDTQRLWILDDIAQVLLGGKYTAWRRSRRNQHQHSDHRRGADGA